MLETKKTDVESKYRLLWAVSSKGFFYETYLEGIGGGAGCESPHIMLVPITGCKSVFIHVLAETEEKLVGAKKHAFHTSP